MIDKYGKCPRCEENWNAGDIKTVLSKLSIFAHKSDYELSQIATKYGWSEFDKTNFSKASSVILEDGREIFKCPNIRCGHLFDSKTEKEYSSIYDVYEEYIINGDTKNMEENDPPF